MIGTIIWYLTMFGCALLFCGIGVYAERIDKPMWFWSGTEVKPDTITDIKAYNQENARMWKWYSVWYWVAGFAWIWNETVALVALFAGCSVGIVILVRTYLKIEKKYKRTGL